MLIKQLVQANLKKKNLPYLTKAYKDGKRITEIEEVDDAKVCDEVLNNSNNVTTE